MTALSDYEDWLDTLDARLCIHDECLTSTLGVGFRVPVQQLGRESQILEAAWAFWLSLQGTNEKLLHPLPTHYLLKRFHRLASGHRHEATFGRFARQFLSLHPELTASQVLGWQRPQPIERPSRGLGWLLRDLLRRWGDRAQDR